jgi:hypothetical protein
MSFSTQKYILLILNHPVVLYYMSKFVIAKNGTLEVSWICQQVVHCIYDILHFPAACCRLLVWVCVNWQQFVSYSDYIWHYSSEKLIGEHHACILISFLQIVCYCGSYYWINRWIRRNSFAIFVTGLLINCTPSFLPEFSYKNNVNPLTCEMWRRLVCHKCTGVSVETLTPVTRISDGGSRFLYNIATFLPDYLASHPRKHKLLLSTSWELQISRDMTESTHLISMISCNERTTL